jgi:hypothetical protein
MHTSLHYNILHCTTLHYTTLYYTTLYHTTIQYTTLHYTPLHYPTLHYTTLPYTTLHYTTLHYTTLHYITLHYTAGENWNELLYDAVDDVGMAAAIYYCSLFVVGNFIIINLFLAILLSNFEQNEVSGVCSVVQCSIKCSEV